MENAITRLPLFFSAHHIEDASSVVRITPHFQALFFFSLIPPRYLNFFPGEHATFYGGRTPHTTHSCKERKQVRVGRYEGRTGHCFRAYRSDVARVIGCSEKQRGRDEGPNRGCRRLKRIRVRILVSSARGAHVTFHFV